MTETCETCKFWKRGFWRTWEGPNGKRTWGEADPAGNTVDNGPCRIVLGDPQCKGPKR